MKEGQMKAEESWQILRDTQELGNIIEKRREGQGTLETGWVAELGRLWLRAGVGSIT